MQHLVLPAIFALFVWWFGTVAVLYLDGLHRRTFKWTMAGATILLGLSFLALSRSAWDTSLRGAYVSFGFAVLAWAWQEISFYTGYVTGPRAKPCPPDARGWRHFLYALGCSLYHEIAVLVSALIVVYVSWGAPNQVGTWTFLVLWWMHESARVNVFLGVANLHEQFLPEHMAFLKSFMTKRPMNLLFPLSVTISTVAAGMLFERALGGGSRAAAAGNIFLATMMSVAILEHWFLVVPLPTEAMWEWGMKSRRIKDRLGRRLFEANRLDLVDVEVTAPIMIKRSRI